MKKILNVLIVVTLLSASLFLLTGCDLTKKIEEIEDGVKKENVKVVKNETSQISYDDFNNGLVSLKIPKGWKVDVALQS